MINSHLSALFSTTLMLHYSGTLSSPSLLDFISTFSNYFHVCIPSCWFICFEFMHILYICVHCLCECVIFCVSLCEYV